MQNLKIGHTTRDAEGTGITVFLFDRPVEGAYVLCGSAPATYELTLLELDAIARVNALVFSGGSAFGLNAVAGVMRWLTENNQGFITPHGVVPIVPAAALYDLSVKKAIAPTAEDAYQACQQATENNAAQGRIGAGTGATIGKMIVAAERMTGGVGHAEMTLPNGVSVLAYAAVNSLGDIYDTNGQIIAGARLPNGEFANCTQYLLSGHDDILPSDANTTLVAIFTNAAFSRAELKRICKMAVAGMARAIAPVFTRYDGDLIVGFSLGEHKACEKSVGTVAAEVVRLAILNAVKDSSILVRD